MGGGRGQARGRDRGGRAAGALPGTDPARPGVRVLPRRARGADDQAAGSRAGGGSRYRLRGGRPPGAPRRTRAGSETVRGMSDEQAVLSERRDRVLEITINRPDQRNAVNAAVAEGISAAL